MKNTLLAFSILLTLSSCGNNNKSGKPEALNIPQEVPYTAPGIVLEEEGFRRDFLTRGQAVLRMFEDEIARYHGRRTVGLIRNRLKYENIEVSERLLFDERNQYVRSNIRNQGIVLYTGLEEPRLSWRNRRNRVDEDTRYVLHELLMLGEIPDFNYFYTDQIIKRR